MAQGAGAAEHVSLYRRFRPTKFSELYGQEHVAKALSAAVESGRVGHAYLFSGPRGTGKTTTARILAKALNCTNVVGGEPCGSCTSCEEITRGVSFDVQEIDAASHNGVEDMRGLIKSASLVPPGRWRVYVLDEVHMLSPGAEAAFLKTLEEPPAQVVFVLATTDPEKVKETIRSRTQHFEFHLLGSDTLTDLVNEVVAKAGIDLGPEALREAVRRGHGSARDTLSALDQIVAVGGELEERAQASSVLEALARRDAPGVLVAFAELAKAGWTPGQVATAMADDLRQAFLANIAPELCEVPEADREPLLALQSELGNARLVRAMEEIGRALVDMRNAPDPRSVLEVAVLRLSHPELDSSPEALLERVERLERSGPPAGAPRTSAPEQVAAPAAAAPAPPARPAPAPAAAPAAPPQAARAPEPGPSAEPAAAPGGPKKTIGALRRERGSAAPAASAPTPAPSEPAPAPVPPAGNVALPDSLEELVQIWQDEVVEQLSAKPRTLYRDARIAAFAPGKVDFMAPNEAHRRTAETCRDEVEAALANRFGQAFTVTITYVPVAEAPPAPAADEAEVEFDLEDSEPVSDAQAGSIATDRIFEAFPGATTVED